MTTLRDPDEGFLPSYGIELLYPTPPSFDPRELERQLELHAADVRPIGRPDLERETPFRMAETEASETESGAAKPSWQIEPADLDAEQIELLGRQSWWWEAGLEVAKRCRFALLLQDLDADSLPYRERLERFQRVLVALLESSPAAALLWRPSEQLVDPRELVETVLADDYSNPLPGAINVRFFRIEDRDEMLMDTRGLAALGLPDLQCHFRGLEPNDVSRVLYSTACYLFDQGPVLRSGNTVQGPNPSDRWRCQLEEAIAEPRRPVIDLDPGFPHAGGAREEDYVLEP